MKLVLLLILAASVFLSGVALRAKEDTCEALYEGRAIIDVLCSVHKEDGCTVQLDDGSIHKLKIHAPTGPFRCADERPLETLAP